MKLLITLVVLAGLSAAQSTPPQTPPAGAQSSSSAGSTQSGSTGATKAPTTPDRASDKPAAPATITEVRRNLEALKTAVAKMDEGPAHDAAEQNVKFLESLVSYLEHEKGTTAGASTGKTRSK